MIDAEIEYEYDANFRHIYPVSSVTPGLVGVVHRPCGGRRAAPRQWSTWPEGHARGMAPVVATSKPKASLGHPGDVHFGLLKPISFIPWLRNGQN